MEGATNAGGNGNGLRVVDLFSGCGGFSLGASMAGFRVMAAVDNDPILASSYAWNFPSTTLVDKDVASLKGGEVRALAGGTVEGVIGGPPCQGFSAIGKRDPSDPRRIVLNHFFRMIRELEPWFFVMENVHGLVYPGSREILNDGLRGVGRSYSLLGPRFWDAAEFGAATRRSRLFIVGIHRQHGEALMIEEVELERRRPATVRAAIADLTGAASLGEADGFDTWRITRGGRPSAYARALRSANGRFTGHRTTRHSEEVAARFAAVPQGGMDAVGRHPRLAWRGQCPALRAGTGADRGSHQALRPIHPTEPRVITVREAARLQGFPDSHRFHPTIWHSFRMIGNSVSPIMAHAILRAIAVRLRGPRSAAPTGG